MGRHRRMPPYVPPPPQHSLVAATKDSPAARLAAPPPCVPHPGLPPFAACFVLPIGAPFHTASSLACHLVLGSGGVDASGSL